MTELIKKQSQNGFINAEREGLMGCGGEENNDTKKDEGGSGNTDDKVTSMDGMKQINES